ncbi:peptidoglycan-binding protein [Streptosporangium sp. NPDC051023]|uniref:peptidoglycan-binding protein n=1 Tax=Streptosporangium sp. NPDC051023 TaxID=3155410 RepID=UPI00344C9BC2
MIKYLAGTVVLSFGVLGFAAPPPDGPLRPGDYAKPVERLQHRLQKLGFSPGLVNGYYGSETQAAVWAFQKSQGLTPEDAVGRRTWKALAHPRALSPLVPEGEPRRVEIDLDRQLLTVYRGDRPMLVSHVSVGAGPYFCQYGHSSTETTPTGDFHAVSRAPRPGADPLVSMYETFSFDRTPWSDLDSGTRGGPQRVFGVNLPVKPVRWVKEPVETLSPAQSTDRPWSPGPGSVNRPTGSSGPGSVDRPTGSSGPGSVNKPTDRFRSSGPGSVNRPTGRPWSPGPSSTTRPTHPILTTGPVQPIPTVKPVYPILTARPVHPIPTVRSVHPAPTARPARPIPIGRPARPVPAVKPVRSISAFGPALMASPVPPAVRPSFPPAVFPLASPVSFAAPVPATGPASGCVRVPSHVAERLFDLVRVGDPVHIRRD